MKMKVKVKVKVKARAQRTRSALSPRLKNKRGCLLGGARSCGGGAGGVTRAQVIECGWSNRSDRGIGGAERDECWRGECTKKLRIRRQPSKVSFEGVVARPAGCSAGGGRVALASAAAARLSRRDWSIRCLSDF